MYRNAWVLILSTGSLLLGAGSVSAGEPLTLDEAVALAQEGAPQLAARQAAVDAASALLISAGRLPDPQLVVGVDNLPVTGADSGSFMRDFMTMRKIGVMQGFPSAQKRRLEHSRAETEVDLAGAELVETRLDVARQAAQAWIRLATARASLDRLRSLESEVALGAAAARAALTSGRGSSADALAAEAAIARLKIRQLQFQSEARQAQAALARWIGEAAARTPAKMPSFDQLPTPAEVLLTTTHLHGTILPFEAKLAEARTDVALARAARRPDWSTEVSFAKRGPDFSDMASLQFTIELPVFARTRQNPVIAARAADVRRVEAEREAEVRMHGAELREMLIAWQQLGEQLTQYERELLPLARERSQVSLAAYRAGQSDLRLSLDAFAEEVNLLIEQAALQNERGRAWAFLRYLEPQHIHTSAGDAP
jgi:cobalt-zinc-cadmium efflux system outer membrane protein